MKGPWWAHSSERERGIMRVWRGFLLVVGGIGVAACGSHDGVVGTETGGAAGAGGSAGSAGSGGSAGSAGAATTEAFSINFFEDQLRGASAQPNGLCLPRP